MSAQRIKRQERTAGGDYFPADARGDDFVSTGSTLLDCILGGGWVLGRPVQVNGDNSVGKTLLAIEAAANFHHRFPKSHVYYRETEGAFDIPYAATLGLPEQEVDFGEDDGLWDCIEDIYEDMGEILKANGKEPAFYAIDSLDALGTRAQRKRDIDEGTYNTEKQRLTGQFFQRYVRQIREAKVLFLIVTQTRAKIGGMGRGVQYTATGGGGKALAFYASQVVHLARVQGLSQERQGIKRPVGIRVKAQCTKNKVGMPARECEFDLRFGFGVDDLGSCLDWLKDVKMSGEVPGWTERELNKAAAAIQSAKAEDWATYRRALKVVRPFVIKRWEEVDARFTPKMRKYE